MRNVGEDMQKLLDRRNLHQELESIREKVLADSDVRAFLAQEKLTADSKVVERSLSKLYEFVQEKDRAQGQENEKFPGYYPKLVMNINYIDVTYVPTEKMLRQQEERAKARRIQLIALPKALKEAEFSRFDLTEEGREEAATAAFDFAEAFRKEPHRFHQGLYIYGPFGVGKTYLLGAIANDLAKAGYESTLIHYPQYVALRKQAIGQADPLEDLTAIQKTPVLMLDDIGAESNSAWVRDDILGVILQYRMNEELPTLFTSNFTLEELEKHLARSGSQAIEPVKASRIMERIHMLAKPVALTGRNRRHS